MSLPRGIRNNNPGNIVRDATRWRGVAADQSGDARFVVFSAAKWGLRALAKVLISYARRHDLDTVRRIIDRWAPPNENDTSVYVAVVAEAISVSPDQRIDVCSPGILSGLVGAVVAHENGRPPAEWQRGATWYSRDQIREAVELALISPLS